MCILWLYEPRNHKSLFHFGRHWIAPGSTETLTSVTQMPLEAQWKGDTSHCPTRTLLIAFPAHTISSGTQKYTFFYWCNFLTWKFCHVFWLHHLEKTVQYQANLNHTIWFEVAQTDLGTFWKEHFVGKRGGTQGTQLCGSRVQRKRER